MQDARLKYQHVINPNQTQREVRSAVSLLERLSKKFTPERWSEIIREHETPRHWFQYGD